MDNGEGKVFLPSAHARALKVAKGEKSSSPSTRARNKHSQALVRA